MQNAFQQGQAQKAVRLYYSGITQKGPVPPPVKGNPAPVDSVMEEPQAFNALLFYFRHVLKKEFGKMEGIVRAKRKPYIPVVLSQDKVDQVIRCLNYPYDLVVKLLYGCGLRLAECMKLRMKDFNFDHSLITIHDEKGKKDRTGKFIVGLPWVGLSFL